MNGPFFSERGTLSSLYTYLSRAGLALSTLPRGDEQ